MGDDFNFDDFDSSFDDGFSAFDDDSFEDRDFSTFGNEDTVSNTQDNSNNTESFDSSSSQGDEANGVKKTAILAIILGFIIILVAFFGMRALASKNKKSLPSNQTKDIESTNDTENKSEEVTSSRTDTTSAGSDTKNNVDRGYEKDINNNKSIINNKNDWKEFSNSDDIKFNENYVDSIFTVIDSKNYVKVVNSEDELLVKTILTGSLSGFTGTYELEVPYAKGSQLLTGNTFKVKVQLGTFKDKKIVGQIVY